MKALVLALAVMGAQAAFAEEALVRKHSGVGFVHPDWGGSETCEVFTNRVVITKQYGFGEKGFTTVETKPLNISFGISEKLKGARTEKIEEKENHMCDGPSTHVSIGPKAEPFILFSTGGCGSPQKDRQGPNSYQLRRLVDTYCPVTHGIRE